MKSSAKKTLKKTKTTIPSNSNLKEVERILAQNLARQDVNITSESVSFIKKFLHTLVTEAEQTATEVPEMPKEPENFTPEGDKQAFDAALDSDTPKDQFDVEGTNPENTAQNIEQIKNWAQKLNDLAVHLNSPETQSLHKILADYDRPGSLMRGITRKASDSITRIAGEISKLKETLNGFINMAPKKQRDLSQIKLG